MASRMTRQRWLWRDRSMAYVALVWILFGVSLAFYFAKWHSFHNEPPVKPEAAVNKKTGETKRFSGSITSVPTGGGLCSQLIFDNRTGRFWNKGDVECEEAIPDLKDQEQNRGYNVDRLRTISKAFHQEGN